MSDFKLFFQVSFLPGCGNTHGTQHPFTVLIEHNLLGIDGIESNLEDKDNWQDDT